VAISYPSKDRACFDPGNLTMTPTILIVTKHYGNMIYKSTADTILIVTKHYGNMIYKSTADV